MSLKRTFPEKSNMSFFSEKFSSRVLTDAQKECQNVFKIARNYLSPKSIELPVPVSVLLAAETAVPVCKIFKPGYL
jgi:hypothetical protein